ncbi:LexA family transcriptional regulator [Pseudomonas sp.]|uniref:XRE family transcriptional regulator n=1 Tax=Pseudomonas sp. TaxID=306 RepID=UPI0028970DD3|nr:LexA family transcriptional regulator [Pseudomonas sp.]
MDINLNRIKALKRAMAGLSQKDFAAKYDLDASYLSQLLNGHRKLGEKAAATLEGKIGLPAGTLVSPNSDVGSDETSNNSYPRTPSEADFVLIPQLSVVGECGDGHLNGHIEIEGGLAFRRDWLTKLSVKPEHCRALYAEGASMEPYIFEDDIVLVDTSDRLPKDRTPYAIRRADGGISFKRLIRQLSGTWLLRSDNPDKAMYPDEEVSATAMHDIPIIGRIIWRGGQM